MAWPRCMQSKWNECALWSLAYPIQFQLNANKSLNGNFDAAEIVQQMRTFLSRPDIKYLNEAQERKRVSIKDVCIHVTEGRMRVTRRGDQLGCSIQLEYSYINSFREAWEATKAYELVVIVPPSSLGAKDTGYLLTNDIELIRQACQECSLAPTSSYLELVVAEFKKKDDLAGCVLLEGVPSEGKLCTIQPQLGWPEHNGMVPGTLQVPGKVLIQVNHAMAAELVLQSKEEGWKIQTINTWGSCNPRPQLKKSDWSGVTMAMRIKVKISDVDEGLRDAPDICTTGTQMSSSSSGPRASSCLGDRSPAFHEDTVVASATEFAQLVKALWNSEPDKWQDHVFERLLRELECEHSCVKDDCHLSAALLITDSKTINNQFRVLLATSDPETSGSPKVYELFSDCKGTAPEGGDANFEIDFCQSTLSCMLASSGEVWTAQALQRFAERVASDEARQAILGAQGVPKGFLSLHPSGKVAFVGMRWPGLKTDSPEWQAYTAAHLLPKKKKWCIAGVSDDGMYLYAPCITNGVYHLKELHMLKRHAVVHAVAHVVIRQMSTSSGAQLDSEAGKLANAMQKHIQAQVMQKGTIRRSRSSVESWCEVWNAYRQNCAGPVFDEGTLLRALDLQCTLVDTFDSALQAAKACELIIYIGESDLAVLTSDEQRRQQGVIPSDLLVRCSNGFVPLKVGKPDAHGSVTVTVVGGDDQTERDLQEAHIDSISNFALVPIPSQDGRHADDCLLFENPWGSIKRKVELRKQTWEGLAKSCGIRAYQVVAGPSEEEEDFEFDDPILRASLDKRQSKINRAFQASACS